MLPPDFHSHGCPVVRARKPMKTFPTLLLAVLFSLQADATFSEGDPS